MGLNFRSNQIWRSRLRSHGQESIIGAKGKLSKPFRETGWSVKRKVGDRHQEIKTLGLEGEFSIWGCAHLPALWYFSFAFQEENWIKRSPRMLWKNLHLAWGPGTTLALRTGVWNACTEHRSSSKEGKSFLDSQAPAYALWPQRSLASLKEDVALE